MDQRLEKGRDTRERLVSTAADLFADQGYDATSIERVLQEAKISRGALYHHFENKRSLFEAVLRHVHQEAVQATISAARRKRDPLEALRAGCTQWVKLARDPRIARIVLIDAPSVVGWKRWREIDEEHSFGIVKAGLRSAAQRGLLPRNLVDPMSHLILAALNELALMIPTSNNPAQAEKLALRALDHLFARLFSDQP